MGLKLRTNSTASQEKKTGAPSYEKHFVIKEYFYSIEIQYIFIVFKSNTHYGFTMILSLLGHTVSNRGSSVNIVIRPCSGESEELEFDSQNRQEILLFSTASRLTPGPT
jgi:hypothetical protein